jgi:Mg-chelatase subunit ChlD
MNTAIVAGSISAMAQNQNKSIAESFVNAEIVVIVDTSGSMSDRDSRGGLSRYDVACEELAALQGSLPGKIAVMAFSNQVQFCPAGEPIYFGGGTDLAGALLFCKLADLPGMRFILISDGEPDDPKRALDVAKTYQNRIDVIYVGPENHPSGRDFLQKLAQATGGVSVTADRAKELQAQIEQLLLAERT